MDCGSNVLSIISILLDCHVYSYLVAYILCNYIWANGCSKTYTNLYSFYFYLSVMANNQEPLQNVCSLPLPPVQYIQNYSDDNIRRGRTPKPPPIIQESYTMFGNPYNADDSIIRPLESQVCFSYTFII